ncbi:MAG: hypothetical protein KIT73_17570 [Burkholderiales bacterium]|nr:hypothetical protein [Burkholderiales bacterium]
MGQPSAAMRQILEAAIRAPSADNQHPLRFETTGDVIRIRAEGEYVSAPFLRRILTQISFGAVVENLSLRAASLGFHASTAWFPDAGDASLIATIIIGQSSGAQDDGLAAAIEARQTNRAVLFRGPMLSEPERRALAADVAATPSVAMHWLDGDLRGPALRLIRTAETERFRDRELHRELFSCIRFDVGWNRSCAEGLPPACLGVEPFLRPAFALLRHWPIMRALGFIGGAGILGLRSAYLPCRLAPHLIALSVGDVSPTNAVSIGRAFQRIWLRLTTLGCAVQPFAASPLYALEGNSAIRGTLRQRLRAGWSDILGPDATPLMVLRTGHCAPAAVQSGRHPLDHKLPRRA